MSDYCDKQCNEIFRIIVGFNYSFLDLELEESDYIVRNKNCINLNVRLMGFYIIFIKLCYIVYVLIMGKGIINYI